MESTYGDSNHPKENADGALARVIRETEGEGGTLLVPSFSVERTQVLLHKIAHFKADGKVKTQTQVYLDSPMGEAVTEIYKKFPSLYNTELASDQKKGDPFSFPGLRVVKDYKESQKIREAHGAKIIIAGSGMMTGGRILEHTMELLPLESTRLLIVGFQAEHTVGRRLEEGAKSVRIYGQEVKVRARVSSLHSLSAHADQKGLLRWLGQIKGVKKVFLVHGEEGPRKALKKEIEKLGLTAFIPHLEESYEI
jgi:metallo-beta-lactamase family protein